MLPPALSTIPFPVPPESVVAEREAIGVVDPFTPITANLALVVACPPIRRSRVELLGVRNPDPSVQLDPPPAPQVPQVTAELAPPPDFKQSLLDPYPLVIPIAPALVILNLVVPEAEAVKM